MTTNETHPFKPFIDESTKYLIVGTIPPHRFCQKEQLEENDINWYYGSKDNDFWEIIATIFDKPFDNISKEGCQEFSKKYYIGFIDLFYEIIRHNKSSSDSDIVPLSYIDIFEIINKYENITTILFTSGYVQKLANKVFNAKYKKYVSRINLIFPEIKINDERNKIKWIHLKSPSKRNNIKLTNKKTEWKKIFEEIKKED